MDRIRNGTLRIDDPVLFCDCGDGMNFGQTHDDDGRVVHYLATMFDDNSSIIIGMAQVLPGWQQAWDDDDDDTSTEENLISLLPLSSDRGVGKALWLENIIVAPRYRRLGVATALLQAIEHEAYEMAANMTTTAMTAEDETTTTTTTTVVELRLTSFRTKSALGLYRSLGYRVVVTTPRWHDDDADRVADDREQRRRCGSSNNNHNCTATTKSANSILFKKKDWWSWTCDAKYPTTLDLVKEVRIV
jgi:GNAT superfamily N-acetyltransferase